MSVATVENTLTTRGIALHNAWNVLGDFSWGILYARGQRMMDDANVRREALRYERGERPTMHTSEGIKKGFVIKGSEHGYGIDDIPADFASLLPVGAKPYYQDIWLHLPSKGTEHTWSQKFHRDPEGDAVFKVFAYLSDVGTDCGPFEYVIGSHKLGTYPEVPRRGYPKANITAERFDEAHQRYTGKAGMMIVANTAGIHRGGVESTKSRLLATWAFLP